MKNQISPGASVPDGQSPANGAATGCDEALRFALSNMVAAARGLKGTAPSFDPCGRGRPCYEITARSMEALVGATHEAERVLAAAKEAP